MKRVSFTAGLVVAGLLFTAQANAREGQALVQSISGEVTMLANGGKWLPLQTGEMLKSGAVVKTGAKSRADLFLGINGSMLRLAANTELKFTRLAIEQSPIEPIAQTEMELISGRVIGNVRKLPMGSSYVIKTPKGVAKVKGTVYDINADGELIVLSGKVKYTDRANGKEVLIASGGKYVGGREVKAADDEKAEAAAPTNGSSFTIGVPLRQGVWENQPNNQKGGPIDPTQFIPPRFNFTATAEMTAIVGANGRIKSVVIVTGGFTESEIEDQFESIKAEYSKAGNYEVGGNQLNADEVDTTVVTVPTGDGLFRIETTVKPKDPEGDLGQAGDSIAVKTVDINLPGASVELIVIPKVSPVTGT
jgi:hypothetical protein